MKAKTNNQVPNILVIDLELNQPSEKVIELGYVIGNLLTNEIHVRKSILVDPKETISPEIVELTGIDQNMVNGASSLDAAYEVMVQDVANFSALPLIHQWGVPDAKILQRQLKSPAWIFGRRWVDVKALAQAHAIINGKKFFGGLKKMAGRIGIEVSGKEAHRADYDAAMTFWSMVDYLAIFSYRCLKKAQNQPIGISHRCLIILCIHSSAAPTFARCFKNICRNMKYLSSKFSPRSF